MEPNHFQYYSKFIQTTALALVMYLVSIPKKYSTLFHMMWDFFSFENLLFNKIS